jgi:2-dehydro-3-deoxygluconokinase
MKVAALGECMVEFRNCGARRYDLAFGGDTFNTAVYLRRLGVAVDYITALGDDSFSDEIVSLCHAEGVGTEHIARLPGRQPGLYVIETDNAGERTFSY